MKLWMYLLLISTILLSGCITVTNEPRNLLNVTRSDNPIQSNTTLDNIEGPIEISHLNMSRNNIFIFPVEFGYSLFYRNKNGRTAIVDSGSKQDVIRTIRFLKRINVTKIDAIIVTNQVDGRAEGIGLLAVRFKPKIIYDNSLPSAHRDEYLSRSKVVPIMGDGEIVNGITVYIGYESGFKIQPLDNSIVLSFDDVFLYVSDCGDECLRDIGYHPILMPKRGGKCTTNSVDTLMELSPDHIIYSGELCKDVSEFVELLDIDGHRLQNNLVQIEYDNESYNVIDYGGVY